MTKNWHLWLLITAVLLLSIQILAITIYIYSLIPLVWDDTFLKGLEPTRDTLFYSIFLFVNVLLMALAVKLFLPKLKSPEILRKFKFWLCLESAWCFLILFCFFKWSTYRYPFWNILYYENHGWLVPLFYAVCAMAALSKVFFPEIEAFYRRIQILGGRGPCPWVFTIALQIAFAAGVIVLLYIPKPQDVAALALAWDQWDHLDAVAGWFIKHGWYLSYEACIQLLVLASIAYIVGLFYFIRLWLNSWLLAAIGALLAIKMGMFYYSTSPCVWMNPANTFLAHGWDIFLFFALWLISVKYPKRFYWAAALFGLGLGLCWVVCGGYIEALGLDDQPMFAPLRVRQFFPFFMGYFIPLFYVFSLLVLMGKKQSRKGPAFHMPVVLCIYGLMIFVDYMEHPAIGYYGALMVPAILTMLWWLQQIFSSSGLFVRRGVYAAILVLAAGALLTNRLMLTYPNILFQDNNRFAHERDFYAHFDIASSAALIRDLTVENQKIVLLSNFETALLMQAHRQPLFKDFPVMYSGFSGAPGGLKLKTRKQCLELIDSMHRENALYVFVDERLLALSGQAMDGYGMKAVLDYLNNHYIFYSRQGFLAALVRR